MLFDFQLDIQTLPIISAFFAAIIIYFGKIISDTKVEKYDKIGFYIEGMFFTVKYIFIPSILAYFIISSFSISFSIFLLFLVQILVGTFLSWNLVAYIFRRFELRNKFKKDAKEKLSKIKESKSTLGKLLEGFWKKADYPELVTYVWLDIPIKWFGKHSMLFVFSFLTVFSTSYLFIYGDVLNFVSSLIFNFYILTSISLSYGFSKAYYPPAEILLEDGTKINGKILKFGDFIYILKENEKFFVNSNKVKLVRESKFKENKLNNKVIL